ncbi:MAG: oligosaccharide flippase family protein [Burkholderiales bacterium]|nr:oligosaccharide flippase family protein [Burkholderiales bacterium]
MSFTRHMKGLSKDALVYGTGFALNSLTGLITAPIATRIFLPEDYGVIMLTQTVMGFLSVIVALNLSSGVFRQYFEYDDPVVRKRVLSTAFWFLVLNGLLYSGLVWLCAPRIETLLLMHDSGAHDGDKRYGFTAYFRILALGVFFSVLDVYLRSLLRMNRRPWAFTAISTGVAVLNVVLFIVLVYFLRLGIEGALWCGVVASIVACAAGLVANAGSFGLRFSRHDLGQFFAYCLPQFPSGVLGWLIVQSSPFLLNYYSSLAQQGQFAIGVRVASVILLFTTAFRLAWDPFALSIMKQDDARMIYARTYSLFCAGLGLAGALLAVYAKPLLIIIAPPPYHPAYALVFVLVAAYLVQEGNNILGIGIAISKRTKFISYAQLIAFVAYGCAALALVPRLGAWGAVIALLGAMYAQALAYNHFARRLYPIPFRFAAASGFMAGIFLLAGSGVWMVRTMGFLEASAVALLYTPLLAGFAYRFGLTQGERKKVLGWLPWKTASP